LVAVGNYERAVEVRGTVDFERICERISRKFGPITLEEENMN